MQQGIYILKNNIITCVDKKDERKPVQKITDVHKPKIADEHVPKAIDMND